VRRLAPLIATLLALAGCGSSGGDAGAPAQGESESTYVERIREFCRERQDRAGDQGTTVYDVCVRSNVAEAIQRGDLPPDFVP